MSRSPILRLAALAAAIPVVLVPALLLAGEQAPVAQPTSQTVPLQAKTYRSFDLRLPAESFQPVGDAIDLGELGRFAVRLEGTALLVDTDGDGETDVKIERDPNAAQATGLVKLARKSADGRDQPYAIRLIERGKGWQFAASGCVKGRIGETQVRIIDQNANGRFDDYGVDAMIVGRSDFACFLSRAVNVAGELHHLEVAPDGSSLSHRGFDGEAGVLDLTSALESAAKLRTAVLVSEDKAYSFDLASGPQRVPAGKYRLHDGLLGVGEGTVSVRRGRSELLTVAKGATTRHEWGGPVRAEFAFARAGDEVTFDPSQVWFYGAAGEEYFDWLPYGKAPEFTVKERETSEEILRVAFPGSC